MAFLTDRTLATGVTLQDLIHIVIPTDVSQNPAGSSYKATIQQVSDAIFSGFTGATQLYEVGFGTDSTQRVGVSADASGNWSLVSGGKGNSASGNYSVTVGGKGNCTEKNFSFVGGGTQNIAAGCLSFVGGGINNQSLGDYSTISGGYHNTTSGDYSTVSGGYRNTSSCYYSTVSGGYKNTSNNNSVTVSGGVCNTSSGYSSTISGGQRNTSSAYGSFVGGGRLNVSANSSSVVTGGDSNTALDFYSSINGGNQNTTNGFGSTIGGGSQNKTQQTYSVIVGGCQNTSNGNYSFIGSGTINKSNCNYSMIIGGSGNTVNACYSIIGDGCGNTTTGQYSFIGNGQNNKTICNYGTILGGSGNTVNHIMSATYGKDVISVSACTFHVNYLALQNTPETDVQTTTQYLTRDSVTGVVKTKTIPGPTVYGLFAQTGNSTTIISNVEGTLIDGGVGTLSVPANSFSVGDSFRADFGGVMSAKNSETITIRVKSGVGGATTISTSPAFTLPGSGVSNQVWLMNLNFTVRAIGPAGTASIVLLGELHVLKLASGDQEGYGWNTVDILNFDTTVNNTLNVTAQWGSNTPLQNAIYSDIFVLNKIY